MQQYPRAHALGSLAVVLYVAAPATVILTAHETIRIDRVAHPAAGDVTVERHGDLLRPGTNAIRLDPGTYHFRTRGAARLYVVDPDSVTVATAQSVKSIPPPAAMWPESGTDASFDIRGSGMPDRVPMLIVTYGDAA
jgi:hypothetical protein